MEKVFFSYVNMAAIGGPKSKVVEHLHPDVMLRFHADLTYGVGVIALFI